MAKKKTASKPQPKSLPLHITSPPKDPDNVDITKPYVEYVDYIKGSELVPMPNIIRIAINGNAMFDISMNKDNRSVTIRGNGTYVVDGVIYSSQLMIKPEVSNSIVISTEPYYTKK